MADEEKTSPQLNYAAPGSGVDGTNGGGRQGARFGCGFVLALGIVGFCGAIGFLALFLAPSPASKPKHIVSVIFFGVAAVSGVVGFICKRNNMRVPPLVLGLMTGLCVIALLEGLCFLGK